MRSLFLVVVACALAMLAISEPVHAAPFTNGSFEIGPSVPASPGFVTLGSGNTSITGWSVRPSSIDYADNNLWTAEDGSRSLDLSGAAPGGVQQVFDTRPGLLYVVRFFLAGNTACGAIVKAADVSATGNPTAHYTFDTTGDSPRSMGWQPREYTFIAAGASTTLSFQSADNSFCGVTLDDVSVTAANAVPAFSPLLGAAAALLLAGVGLLLLRRVRRTPHAP